MIKAAKNAYDKNQIDNAQKNTKKLWEAIKSITNTSKLKSSADALVSATNPTHSVNEVNGYFANIGRTLAENISTSHALPRPSTVNDTSFPNSFALLETDDIELNNLIENLRDAFKLAVVLPIHKGGDRYRLNNYRPISILPTLSKLLERLVNSRLVKFLEINSILSCSQYGFRSGLSTGHAVLNLTNYIISNLDRHQRVIGIFLDLAKANWLLDMDYDSTEELLHVLS
ncbi:uncharacterized protein LOC111359638 [Spodoptera litura]|uniref:Uncharacterized protein LOC111359638 n=1 Tax=Spodoptera litura TaxID=69820 RepID=A0A9J7ELS8_SPOLT|nr:uncharacterized protein LOC111359638 [Spodoptera litura]